mmetsp:Transcript_585/g.1642  ORF Transcript_585/g.1642 Transcript_585/m.1642 type:complete len:466 (-) Transcript_585:7-1404(-)
MWPGRRELPSGPSLVLFLELYLKALQLAQPLHQRRVREVVPRVPGVRIEVALVLLVDLEEAAPEGRPAAHGHREAVRLELKMPTQHGHQQRDELLSRAVEHHENHQRHHHRLGVAVAELADDLLRGLAGVHDRAIQVEEHEDVRGGDDEVEQGVTELPVPQLVAEDRQDVLLLQVQQRVVQHDPLVLPESEEVGVAVRGALGAVYLEELRQGKFDLGGERLDLEPQVVVLQGLELVEDGLDEVRVDPHHRQHEHLAEAPEVQVEALSEVADDPDEHRDQEPAEEVREQLALHQILQEKLHRHLVEAVLLLHHEVRVELEGDGDRLVDPLEEEEPEERGGVLLLEAPAGEARRHLPAVRRDDKELHLIEDEVHRVPHEAKQALVLLVGLRLEELGHIHGALKLRRHLGLAVLPKLAHLEVLLQDVQHRGEGHEGPHEGPAHGGQSHRSAPSPKALPLYRSPYIACP